MSLKRKVTVPPGSALIGARIGSWRSARATTDAELDVLLASTTPSTRTVRSGSRELRSLESQVRRSRVLGRLGGRPGRSARPTRACSSRARALRVRLGSRRRAATRHRLGAVRTISAYAASRARTSLEAWVEDSDLDGLAFVTQPRLHRDRTRAPREPRPDEDRRPEVAARGDHDHDLGRAAGADPRDLRGRGRGLGGHPGRRGATRSSPSRTGSRTRWRPAPATARRRPSSH